MQQGRTAKTATLQRYVENYAHSGRRDLAITAGELVRARAHQAVRRCAVCVLVVGSQRVRIDSLFGFGFQAQLLLERTIARHEAER